MNYIILSLIILAIAFLMTMTGRGGGNFYVVALVAAGMSMHQSAASGQFILMVTALCGMLIFSKNKLVDWKLALVIDPATDVMAFAGGYFSEYIGGVYLKFIFSAMLVIAGFLMLMKFNDRPLPEIKRPGYWHRTFGDSSYVVNLWIAIPVCAVVGLASGALGISGGSFKVPLMVLLCGVPMPIAVGTSSAMVAATALMGFIGHAAQGHFELQAALPFAAAAAVGGILGGKLALKTKPKRLKLIFALTTLAAAGFMVVNALTSV
ncbi:MAG: sulfite exporter TauE/SafE family protein [Spirochaetales bacterium]|uniref:Probable membrane transporter protein n=1 Tax=Candidatus Thalassospirochaeta sargassi TaxID=3119039 RepID=A0AAJ1IF30_9SPIO|nr:sulfite exporter TauE/SafE family protein [Spirochaetales bacterium]